MKAKLTCDDICSQAGKSYLTLLNAKKWTPAGVASDSKAAPANFGALAANSLKSPSTTLDALAENLIATSDAAPNAARVFTLIQQMGNTSGPKPNDKCRLCNTPGHWARNCPLKHQRKNNSNGSSSKSASLVLVPMARLVGRRSLLRMESLKPRSKTGKPFVGVPSVAVGPQLTVQTPEWDNLFGDATFHFDNDADLNSDELDQPPPSAAPPARSSVPFSSVTPCCPTSSTEGVAYCCPTYSTEEGVTSYCPTCPTERAFFC